MTYREPQKNVNLYLHNYKNKTLNGWVFFSFCQEMFCFQGVFLCIWEWVTFLYINKKPPFPKGKVGLNKYFNRYSHSTNTILNNTGAVIVGSGGTTTSATVIYATFVTESVPKLLLAVRLTVKIPVER